MSQEKLLIPKRTNWTRDLAILVLLWLSTVGFYYLSLLGGDLEFIKQNLSALGRYILISTVSFYTFNLLFFRWFASSAYSSSGGWTFKIIQILIIVGTVTLLYGMDTGENFEHHGAYNMIIFLILFVPTITITLGVMSFVKWLSPSNRKNCKRFSIFGFLVFAVYVIFALLYYHWKWQKGLNSSHVESNNGVCEFRGHNIPWIDLLPDGVQNFWTGSQTCPGLPKTYTAKIVDGSVLVENCPETPTVTFFPNTKNINYSQKVLTKFQVAVKDGWFTTDVNPLGVRIPLGVEAMLVECGEDQEKQLLYHIPKLSTNSIADTTNRTNSTDRIQQNLPHFDTTQDQIQDLTEKKPNILVLYIDALSRRHFYRKMKKTAKWLEKQQAGDQMDVLQFFRYHAVGFNTEQNSRALYCGGNEDVPKFFENAKQNPLCPIWRPMKQQFDYSTVLITNFCEDWPSMFLNFTRSEFADHEMLAPFCHPDYYPYSGNPFGNFKGPYSILRRCLFGDYVHKHSLTYMEKIIRTKKEENKPYYMHSIFTEAHEGTGEVISTMDEDLSSFLNKMEEENLLDDTIVMFISDHGLHMGLNFAFSENGMLEHKLPLLNILVPTKFNKEARDKLRANEQKLVTAFDVHKTLLMLPGFRGDGSFKPDNYSQIAAAANLTVITTNTSLFDQISWRRTCEDARIPADTCACDVRTVEEDKDDDKNPKGFLAKNNE